ncbi:uncharacterized protein [Paralichthys olivaceus]|uniref:uncharacterized protein n=1 Tax=Paralichthys olivaceus TaxID=8255 RepID=UPI003750215F
MGNCTSGTKKSREDESAPDDRNHTDNKPVEDVTYASIDHSTAKGSRTTRAVSDDDCDYATVQVPAAPEPESESESEPSLRDDYVLMG